VENSSLLWKIVRLQENKVRVYDQELHFCGYEVRAKKRLFSSVNFVFMKTGSHDD
jgi:hypothetical protein